MLNVTIVLLGEGFASTAIAPAEIFYAAGALYHNLRGEAGEHFFQVETASVDGGAVKVPYGFTLAPQKSIHDVKRTDIIMVPTSGLDLDLRMVENSALLPWLNYHHARGAYVAGACMGSAYLAEAGLLDGRVSTTHWARAEDFARRYPSVQWRPDLLITEDARTLSSGGVCASMDLSLYLVEKLVGHDVAVKTAKALLLNMPRLQQTGYATLPFSREHSDASIREAEKHLQAHFRTDVSVHKLAAHCAMSPRNFLRRFKNATGRLPGAYLQSVRVEAAKAMLERERTSVQSVAHSVGYDDASFFRALFKRETGMTPGEYRTHFAAMNVRTSESERPEAASPNVQTNPKPKARPAGPQRRT